MKFTDQIDLASHLADLHTEDALKKWKEGQPKGQVPNEDGTYPVTECVICGVEIPELRLQYGFVKCVDCQTDDENRKKLGRWRS
jgi:RNA polymerase-binding transcription factor DksA